MEMFHFLWAELLTLSKGLLPKNFIEFWNTFKKFCINNKIAKNIILSILPYLCRFSGCWTKFWGFQEKNIDMTSVLFLKKHFTKYLFFCKVYNYCRSNISFCFFLQIKKILYLYLFAYRAKYEIFCCCAGAGRRWEILVKFFWKKNISFSTAIVKIFYYFFDP